MYCFIKQLCGHIYLNCYQKANDHQLSQKDYLLNQRPRILARDGIGLLWTATRAEENIITSSDWNRFVLKHDLIEWTYYKYPELVVKQ